MRRAYSLPQHKEHFVQFIGWYNDNKRIYIAMEYMECGDFNKFLIDYGSEAKKMAKVITRQLTEGFIILHEKGICHRDLNPKACPLFHLIALDSNKVR